MSSNEGVAPTSSGSLSWCSFPCGASGFPFADAMELACRVACALRRGRKTIWVSRGASIYGKQLGLTRQESGHSTAHLEEKLLKDVALAKAKRVCAEVAREACDGARVVAEGLVVSQGGARWRRRHARQLGH